VKALCAALAAGLIGCGAASAATPPRVRSLPWPPVVLPQAPPLAPETSAVLPLQPRFLGRIGNRERVVVGVDDSGEPHTVRVLQQIVVSRLGDYVFAVPAPVVDVTPGPGTDSMPGQRENQILWEGFSPGHRVLAAWARLRSSESAGSLPVRVKVETTVDGAKLEAGERRSGSLTVQLSIRNATVVSAQSFTGEPDPLSLAQVTDRIRDAIRRDVFAEGVNVGFFGDVRPVKERVAAPLLVEGTLRFAEGTVELPGTAGGVVRFSRRLDGLERSELLLDFHGRALSAGAPKIELRVTKARIGDTVAPPGTRTWVSAYRRGRLGDPRRLLRRAIGLELTYARQRQYDMFLASPDIAGPSETTYVYRTAAPARASAGPGPADDGDHTLGWILLAIGLAVALPTAAVIWARS
jgi:hypothetical protein